MPLPTSPRSVPALACVLALVGALLPATVSAASPAPAPAATDPAPPWVMKQAADAMATSNPGPLQPPGPVAPLRQRALPGLARPATAAPPPLSREVFAFANAGDLGNASVGYKTWTFSLLSTVAYFGIHVNTDGTLVRNDTGWNVWHSKTATDFITAAHNAGTRVVLSIIYQDTGQGMCTALDQGVQTALAIKPEIANLGADGLNIDYEGGNQRCPDGHWQSEKMSAFTQAVRQRVPGYLSIDTYASSGGAPGNFFDVGTLAGYVDSFFVMDYALETSNGPCSKCMGPTSPLAGYTWTVTRSADAYTPWAGKTILGFPYYGVKGCVTGNGPNAVVASPSNYGYEPYYLITGDPSDPKIHNWTAHVDGNDPAGQEKWATFHSDYTNCDREMYWDDATSLGLKYDLVNQRGFRGAGIFTLDYGGGSGDLWEALAGHFSYAPRTPIGVHACPGDGFAVVNWTPPGAGAAPITNNLVTASPGGAVTQVGAVSQTVVRGLADGTAYTLGVQAGNGYGRGPSGFSNYVTPVSSVGTWPGQFHPLTPKRVLDSRDGTGGVSGRLGPGQVVNVGMLGAGGVVPAGGVAAVLLNVGATDATAPGYLEAYATGSCQPLASNLNFGPGVTGTNLVTATLGSGGAVSFANGSSGLTNIFADVAGWISTAPTNSGAAGALQPLTPARIMDTRGGNPLYPGEASAISLPVLGRGGLPGAGVLAVVLNLTVVNPRGAGFVAAYPGATRWPVNSNVNFEAGQTIPNRVVVPVGANGQVQFVSSVLTDVIADVGGWFTDASGTGGGKFTGSTPVRILDTRDGTGGYGPAGSGRPFSLPIAGQPGLPGSGIKAVVLNVTATDANAGSFVTVYPSDAGHWPMASDLNTAPGGVSANLVVVAVATAGPDAGKVSFVNASGDVNLIVDLVGWYG